MRSDFVYYPLGVQRLGARIVDRFAACRSLYFQRCNTFVFGKVSVCTVLYLSNLSRSKLLASHPNGLLCGSGINRTQVTL